MPEKQKMRMSPLDGGPFAVAFFCCRLPALPKISFVVFDLYIAVFC